MIVTIEIRTTTEDMDRVINRLEELGAEITRNPDDSYEIVWQVESFESLYRLVEQEKGTNR